MDLLYSLSIPSLTVPVQNIKQQAMIKFNNSEAIETINMAIQNCSDFLETEIL